MKVCSGCAHEYAEDFKFCPECGQAFGGQEAAELKRKLDQNLMDMKRAAGQEAVREQRGFAHLDAQEWANAGL